MFCVRCGKESELHDALCADCYRETRTLVKVPAIVRVEVCAHCGARHRGGSWGAPILKVEVAVAEEARAALEVDRRVERWELTLDGGEHDPTNFEFEAIVRGRAEGVDFEARAPVTVHVQKSTCTRCGRKAGGYYESIVQLRAEDRDLTPGDRARAGEVVDRILQSMHDAGDYDGYLTKMKEVRGGPDFYLGTVNAGRNIAKALSNEMGASVRESATLVTRDRTGQDVYRVTFSVKLPRSRVGGFVAIDERLYFVTGLSSRTATLVDLKDHRRVVRPRPDLEGAEVLEPSAAQDAVVVSAGGREIQVLDPETMRTLDLPVPEGYTVAGDTVSVVRWGERLWLVPRARAPRADAAGR